MGLILDLPQPPAGRRGWPWTEESGPAQETVREGDGWPRISIVTPSFNQGQFLEETIRSVLLQNYPNLEYIIMDGGSSDDSVEIIKKYEQWLDFWVSEPDGGQSEAINVGLGKATGTIINWLNSDDLIQPGALQAVAKAYLASPQSVAWVGKCNFIRENGEMYEVASPVVGAKRQFANWGGPDSPAGQKAWVGQPSCYFSRQAFLDVGGLNAELYFTMDVELWIKLAERGTFEVLPDVISSARVYPGIKTQEDYPGRMTEHVVINWMCGEKELAREKIVEFGERYTRERVLSMGVSEISVLVATWIYRKFIKNPMAFIRGRMG